MIHDFAQFGALVALDAARNAAATRVVGHQNKVAAGETDESRQRCALVAALVLVDLDDDFLALTQCFADGRLAGFDTGLEIGAGNFLERQEAVAFRSIVDERRFETGLDARDYRLVNVAFLLFLCGRFNVEVNKFLTIDNGDTEFFGLCRIEEHAFHDGLPRAITGGAPLQAATD